MAKGHADRQVFLGSVEVLSEAKARAETRVKLVRSLVADGELASDGLRRIQACYSDARAVVNAGFDRLLIELGTGGGSTSADSYADLAGRAARHVELFVTASDSLILGEDRSGLGTAAVGAAPGLFGALVEVWQTIRGERREDRVALVARLESLKWEPFDQIS